MDHQHLRRRADATLTCYHMFGQEPHRNPLALGTLDPDRPRVWDANQIRSVRAGDPDGIASVMAWSDDLYSGLAHRRVAIDSQTPGPFEARLALDGWTVTPVIQAVLTGSLRIDRPLPPGVAIRPVSSADDWAEVARLARLDHVEAAAREHRAPWDESVTAAMVGHRRRKAPDVQAFLASLEGEDVAMFSSVSGVDAMGMVEDLFVKAEVRDRGIAIALIAHCVADARSRGAVEVMIASRPFDWPKRLYARLGFRPLFVERLWDLEVGEDTGDAGGIGTGSGLAGARSS